MFLDLDSLTEIQDESLFALERLPDRIYEYDYHTQFSLEIEMNLDTKEFKR